MTAQEQSIEERGFALREIEFVQRLFGSSGESCRIGLSRHSQKNAVYRFRVPRQEYVTRKEQNTRLVARTAGPEKHLQGCDVGLLAAEASGIHGQADYLGLFKRDAGVVKLRKTVADRKSVV